MKPSKRTRLLLISPLLAALVVGGLLPLAAHGARPADKSQELSEETKSIERVETILRDESRSAEERVRAALAELDKLPAEEEEEDDANDSKIEFWRSWDADPAQRWWHRPSPLSRDWDPFAEMRRMREMTQRLFEDMDRQMGMLGFHSGRSLSGGLTWSPSAEFAEENDVYVLRFDLPGVDNASINVTVKDDRLTIEGSRESKSEQTEKDDAGNVRVLRREFASGAFSRTVPIPSDADETNMKTSLEDGVLTVTLPKIQHAQKIGGDRNEDAPERI